MLVSAFGLAVTSPLFIIVGLCIKASMPGPVFYKSVRIGAGANPFEIWKFRTMVVNADSKGPSSTSANDPRVTPLGALLRKYKVDEIPQLWNVLRGDMSLVGPRPQVPWAVELYTPEERAVLNVKPGITDPASIKFANEADILRGHGDPDKAYFELIHPEKMRLSIEYIKERSFSGDTRILLATVRTALGMQVCSPNTETSRQDEAHTHSS